MTRPRLNDPIEPMKRLGVATFAERNEISRKTGRSGPAACGELESGREMQRSLLLKAPSFGDAQRIAVGTA